MQLLISPLKESYKVGTIIISFANEETEAQERLVNWLQVTQLVIQ